MLDLLHRDFWVRLPVCMGCDCPSILHSSFFVRAQAADGI